MYLTIISVHTNNNNTLIYYVLYGVTLYMRSIQSERRKVYIDRR